MIERVLREMMCSTDEQESRRLGDTLIAPVGGTGPHNHLILTAPHPSPLAARSGYAFSGCRHFSRCNEWLRSRGERAVDWYLPEPGPDGVATPYPTQEPAC